QLAEVAHPLVERGFELHQLELVFVELVLQSIRALLFALQLGTRLLEHLAAVVALVDEALQALLVDALFFLSLLLNLLQQLIEGRLRAGGKRHGQRQQCNKKSGLAHHSLSGAGTGSGITSGATWLRAMARPSLTGNR